MSDSGMRGLGRSLMSKLLGVEQRHGLPAKWIKEALATARQPATRSRNGGHRRKRAIREARLRKGGRVRFGRFM